MGLLNTLEKFGLEGLKKLIGNAQPGDVLNGKTFSNANGNDKVGTMPNKVDSATVITPSTADQAIPQGYYGGAAADGKVAGSANLVTGNIKAGVSIFGVNGKIEVVDTTEAVAPIAAGNVLSGKKAFVNGNLVTGTMANQGQKILTPGTANVTIPAGYHDGTGYVQGDADLVSANIKAGINIFGVAGNYTAKRFATGTVSTAGGPLTVSGLAFRPKYIITGLIGGGSPGDRAVYAEDTAGGGSPATSLATFGQSDSPVNNVFTITSDGFQQNYLRYTNAAYGWIAFE